MRLERTRDQDLIDKLHGMVAKCKRGDESPDADGLGYRIRRLSPKHKPMFVKLTPILGDHVKRFNNNRFDHYYHGWQVRASQLIEQPDGKFNGYFLYHINEVINQAQISRDYTETINRIVR